MLILLRAGSIASIFILLFVSFFHPITAITQDLGRHILTGKIILQTFSIPKTNLFSYTHPDFPFINHHWLSEVVFYLIYENSGFTGLLVTTTIIVLAAYAVLFYIAAKKYPTIPLIVASFLYSRILMERTDVRPEVFSFLFLSLFIVILYRYKQTRTRFIVILPITQLLWANMHIYFPIGIAVLGLFLLDDLLTHRNKLFNKYTCILIIVTTASVVSCLANPNGINGALYPLRVFNNYGYSIEENQNIFFLWTYAYKPTIIFFALAVCLIFFSLFAVMKKTFRIDWFLVVFFTILGIIHIRNFPLFVLGTFIPFTHGLSLIYATYIKRPMTSVILQNSTYLLLLIVIGISMSTTISEKAIGASVVSGIQPAVDFFIRNGFKGPLFNNFDIGSYLEYRLYPTEKVFVDGRPEAYPSSFFQNVYIPMQENKKTFDDVAYRYKLNTIFFAHTDQTPWATLFFKAIVHHPDWKIVYLDDTAIILMKNTPKNKLLIDKFGMSKQNLSFIFEKSDFHALLRLASFFQKIGWRQYEEKMYYDLLNIQPFYCPALYHLSVIKTQQQATDTSIYTSKYRSYCS